MNDGDSYAGEFTEDVDEPGPGPGSGPGPQPGPQPTSTIDKTIAVFERWLVLSSRTPLYAMLGTIAANLLPGDAVWLGLIAPSSSAKTELLISTSRLPHVVPVSNLTLPAFLSGTPKHQREKDTRGGLLRQIGDFGILALKDFGSVLSMRPDAKSEILGALREIYDGSYVRQVGTGGGRRLEWHGKMGLLFGCTGVIDSHHSVIGAMGERFLFSRLTPEKNQFIHALKHAGKKTADMRRELAQAVADLFAAPLREPRPLSKDEENRLQTVCTLVTHLRAPIERDRYTREIEAVYGAEGTGRLGLTLERLLLGLDSLGVKREIALDVVISVAMDSVPPIRRSAYECVCEHSDVSTTDVAIALDLPTVTVHRALEDLAAYHLIERHSRGQGKADRWTPVDADDDEEQEPPPPEPPPSPPPQQPTAQAAAAASNGSGGGIPFVMLNKTKQALRERGYSDEQIAEMTPEQARDIIDNEAPRPEPPLTSWEIDELRKLLWGDLDNMSAKKGRAIIAAKHIGLAKGFEIIGDAPRRACLACHRDGGVKIIRDTRRPHEKPRPLHPEHAARWFAENAMEDPVNDEPEDPGDAS